MIDTLRRAFQGALQFGVPVRDAAANIGVRVRDAARPAIRFASSLRQGFCWVRNRFVIGAELVGFAQGVLQNVGGDPDMLAMFSRFAKIAFLFYYRKDLVGELDVGQEMIVRTGSLAMDRFSPLAPSLAENMHKIHLLMQQVAHNRRQHVGDMYRAATEAYRLGHGPLSYLETFKWNFAKFRADLSSRLSHFVLDMGEWALQAESYIKDHEAGILIVMAIAIIAYNARHPGDFGNRLLLFAFLAGALLGERGITAPLDSMIMGLGVVELAQHLLEPQ